jgi:hypothetical protein
MNRRRREELLKKHRRQLGDLNAGIDDRATMI